MAGDPFPRLEGAGQGKANHGELVECPSCGQLTSAERLALIAQANAAAWDHDRRIAAEHSWRFRNLGGMTYPHTVARAYDGDIERALADSDEAVAARVLAWEREQGFEPANWAALGVQFRAMRDEYDNADWPF